MTIPSTNNLRYSNALEYIANLPGNDLRINKKSHYEANLHTLPQEVQFKIALLAKESIPSLRLTCKGLNRSLQGGFTKAVSKQEAVYRSLNCYTSFEEILEKTSNLPKAIFNEAIKRFIFDPQLEYSNTLPDKKLYKNLQDFEFKLTRFCSQKLPSLISNVWNFNAYEVTINLQDSSIKGLPLELIAMSKKIKVNLLNCQELFRSQLAIQTQRAQSNQMH